jgi:hypothetical protein
MVQKDLGHVALEAVGAQPVDLALDPHPPLSLGQHLRCALGAMHSRLISGCVSTQRALLPGPERARGC